MKISRRTAGFSLVEIIVVVAVVGVVASLSYAVVGDITGSAKKEKLNSDSRTLNRAVMAYLAAGGSLDDAESADQVLARLRTEATAALSKRLPGLSSTFMDPRVSFRMQNEKEAASGDARVYWNPSETRFELAFSGDSAGIKEFYFDDKLAETDKVTEDRKHTMVYNDKPGWIWDYQDRSFLSPPPGPTVVATVPDTGYSTPLASDPGAGSPSGGAPLAPGADLLPPEFSIPGGEYAIDNFDLSVGLINPNPSGVSALYYQINYGQWQPYSGNLPTPPGTVVSAQVVALDPNYQSTAKVNQKYEASPAQLASPAIDSSAIQFGYFFDRTVWVNLIDTNEPDVAQIRYRLNGGHWIAYSDPFSLSRDGFPGGVTIEAQAVARSSPYYLSSALSSRELPAENLLMTGTASGFFFNPDGPRKMVTNLGPGAMNSYFEWGDNAKGKYTSSFMDFSGTGIENVTGNERFLIGDLNYFNGTYLAGTGAAFIDLRIDLDLSFNGYAYNPYFDFTFDLINTINHFDPNDPWQDADYVRARDNRASWNLVAGEYEFEFRIEFGETTEDGFAYFDEFHVLEEKSARVKVYGTFVEIGKVGDYPDPEPESTP